MAPLTDHRPKCLLKLAGTSLLERQTATLNRLGISDITVLTGYLAEQIAAEGYRTIVNRDYADSNMVYTLFRGRSLMDGRSDLVVSYGDIVYEPRVLQAVLDCRAPMCVAVDQEWRRYWELRMADPLADAETLKLDGQGMITELGKKPRDYTEIQGQYLGLFKIRKDQVRQLLAAYDALDPDGPYDGKSRREMYMTSFIQHLIDDGWQVAAVPVAGGWLEVDIPDDLRLYERMHSEGVLGELYDAGPESGQP